MAVIKKTLFRALFTVGVLGYLYFETESQHAAMIASFYTIDYFAISTAFVILVIITLLQIFRWHLVCQYLRIGTSLHQHVNIFLGANFAGLVLPSSMGGDFVRIASLVKHGIHTKQSLRSVFLDKLSGLYALIVIVCASNWYLVVVRGLSNAILVSGLYISLAMLMASCVLVVVFGLKIRFYENKWVKVVIKIVSDFKATNLSLTLGSSLFIVSSTIQILASVAIYFVAVSLNAGVAFLDCILLTPMVFLATMIPLSIAGWGVREAAVVMLLGVVNTPVSDALLTSLVFGMLMTLIGIVSGYIWALDIRWGRLKWR